MSNSASAARKSSPSSFPAQPYSRTWRTSNAGISRLSRAGTHSSSSTRRGSLTPPGPEAPPLPLPGTGWPAHAGPRESPPKTHLANPQLPGNPEAPVRGRAYPRRRAHRSGSRDDYGRRLHAPRMTSTQWISSGFEAYPDWTEGATRDSDARGRDYDNLVDRYQSGSPSRRTQRSRLGSTSQARVSTSSG